METTATKCEERERERATKCGERERERERER